MEDIHHTGKVVVVDSILLVVEVLHMAVSEVVHLVALEDSSHMVFEDIVVAGEDTAV